MRIATILGTRPDFIKAAPVSWHLATIAGVEEIIIHTGQHYDAALSDHIVAEVGLPRPRCSLNRRRQPALHWSVQTTGRYD